MKMNLILDRINRILSQNKWSESDIYNVMANFRQLLEENNLKEKYQILNLYCNWTLHTSIKQSISAYRILERISDALILYGAGEYEEGHVSDIVIETIALHKLFEEIMELSDKYKIEASVKFQDIDTCHLFVGELLLILLGKPLVIDHNSLKRNKKLEKIGENMYRKCLAQKISPDYYLVLGFAFVIANNKINWRLMTKYTVNNNISLTGKVVLIDQKELDRVQAILLQNQNSKNE